MKQFNLKILTLVLLFLFLNFGQNFERNFSEGNLKNSSIEDGFGTYKFHDDTSLSNFGTTFETLTTDEVISTYEDKNFVYHQQSNDTSDLGTGNYFGSEMWTGYADGVEPPTLSSKSGTNTFTVQSSYQGHNKVGRMLDNTASASVYYEWNSKCNSQSIGTFEMAFCVVSVTTSDLYPLYLGYKSTFGGSNLYNAFVGYVDGSLIYRQVFLNGTSVNMGTLTANIWYYLKIEFNMETNYLNLTIRTDSATFYSKINSGFYQTIPAGICINGFVCGASYGGRATMYLDSISYSWDGSINYNDWIIMRTIQNNIAGRQLTLLSEYTTLTLEFDVFLESEELTFHVNNTSNIKAFEVLFRDNYIYYVNASVNLTILNSYMPYSTNDWMRIKIEFTKNGATNYYINSFLFLTFTARNFGAKYIYLGSINGGEFYLDNVYSNRFYLQNPTPEPESNIQLFSESDQITEWRFDQPTVVYTEDFSNWSTNTSSSFTDSSNTFTTRAGIYQSNEDDNSYYSYPYYYIHQSTGVDKRIYFNNYFSYYYFYYSRGFIDFNREEYQKHIETTRYKTFMGTSEISIFASNDTDVPTYDFGGTPDYTQYILWADQPLLTDTNDNVLLDYYGEQESISTDYYQEWICLIMDVLDDPQSHLTSTPWLTNYHSLRFLYQGSSVSLISNAIQTINLSKSLGFDLESGDIIEFSVDNLNNIDFSLYINENIINSYSANGENTYTYTIENDLNNIQLSFLCDMNINLNFQLTSFSILRSKLLLNQSIDIFYLNPFSKLNELIEIGEYSVMIYENSELQQIQEINITSLTTITNIFYEKTGDLECQVGFYSQNDEVIDFSIFRVYLTRTLFQLTKTYLMTTQRFFADEFSNYSLLVLDRFENTIYSISDILIEQFIDIQVNVYSLKIGNFQKIDTYINITKDLNSWTEFLLMDEIIQFQLFEGNYSFSYTDEEEITQQLNLTVTHDSLIRLNTSYFQIYFSFFNADGLGINAENFRFYVNGIRKDFGLIWVFGLTHILIMDYFNQTLFEDIIDFTGLTEYNFYIPIYNLLFDNKFDEDMKIKISRSGIDFDQKIPAHKCLNWRFLANIQYTIKWYYNNGTLAETDEILLNEENKIVNFGFYSEIIPATPIDILNAEWNDWFSVLIIAIFSIAILIIYNTKKNSRPVRSKAAYNDRKEFWTKEDL